MKKIIAAGIGLGCLALFIGCGGTAYLTQTQGAPIELNDQPLSVMGPPLTGAVFTSDVSGNVNINIYQNKEDVYLNGGPGPQAPTGAAGLPEGTYYFQVTDPSGGLLLSSDDIDCRIVHVGAAGVFDAVDADPLACLHDSISTAGAIAVQLIPYDDTPNDGGYYKVWITPTEDYKAGEGFNGFIPADSKTDNFKVETGNGEFVLPILIVRKFHDKNVNGIQDNDELGDVMDWDILITDPLDFVSAHTTTVMIETATIGNYVVHETTPPNTLQTVSYLDELLESSYPSADPTVNVMVVGLSGEDHEVLYGNVGLGSIEACKYYDRDGDGVVDVDPPDPGIEGWKMQLEGLDVTGQSVGPTLLLTDSLGCALFTDLLPGDYTVTEIIPSSEMWVTTSATSFMKTLASMLPEVDQQSGSFTNFCVGFADFGTKLYWHNKNGLGEITSANIDYVNSLKPYDNPSSYFEAGDEPFNGWFADNTEVSAAKLKGKGSLGEAGTALAEISHFLVDANANGDSREQLAQQLLAFIFNTLHRLDGPDTLIQHPDLSYETASAIINQSIQDWLSGSDAERHDRQQLLDDLNSNDVLPFIHSEPCDVVY